LFNSTYRAGLISVRTLVDKFCWAHVLQPSMAVHWFQDYFDAWYWNTISRASPCHIH